MQTAKAKADPYGMTTKRNMQKQEQRQIRGSFDCVARKVLRATSLRMTGVLGGDKRTNNGNGESRSLRDDNKKS